VGETDVVGDGVVGVTVGETEVVGDGVGEFDGDGVGETDVVGDGAQLAKATDMDAVESPPVMVAAAGATAVPPPVPPQLLPVWLCVLGLCSAASRSASA